MGNSKDPGKGVGRAWFHGAHLVSYLLLLGLFWVVPEERELLGGFGIFCLLGSGVLLYGERKALRFFWQGPLRSILFKYLFRSVLLFLNGAILYYLVAQMPWSMDITQSKTSSLTHQTVQVLSQLKSEGSPPLTFWAFFQKAHREQVLPLFNLYRRYYPTLRVEFADPAFHPNLVKKFGVEQYGQVIVDLKDKKYKVKELSELSISGAINHLMGDAPAVYFVSGHGENSIDDKGELGLSTLKTYLEQSFYKIFDGNLLDLPQDSKTTYEHKTVVLWGVRQDLLEKEIGVLKKVLDGGGSLLFALDPQPMGERKRLTNFLLEHGIRVYNGFVLDKRSFITSSRATVPLVSRYPNDHAIVHQFNKQTFFPLPLGLKRAHEKNDLEVSELIETSAFPYSWLEVHFESLAKNMASFDEVKTNKAGVRDEKGPWPMLVVSSKKGARRVGVFASSSFVRNSFKNFNGQYLMFLNALGWMSHKPFKLANDRPLLKEAPFILSRSHQSIIFYTLVIFIPTLFSFQALYLYRRRLSL